MLASTLFALLPLLLSEAVATPAPAVAPIPGYKVVDLQFELEVFPGQFKNFTGTIQSATKQAALINPDFNQFQHGSNGDNNNIIARDPRISRHPDYKSIYIPKGRKKILPRDDAGLESQHDHEAPAELDARGVSWKNTECKGWKKVEIKLVQDGIDYLRGLKGRPRNGPGPSACGRVSCSWQTAIWWCNDNKTPHTLSSWADIAEGADKVKHDCQFGTKWTRGQVFAKDNWNVIVRGDDC